MLPHQRTHTHRKKIVPHSALRCKTRFKKNLRVLAMFGSRFSRSVRTWANEGNLRSLGEFACHNHNSSRQLYYERLFGNLPTLVQGTCVAGAGFESLQCPASIVCLGTDSIQVLFLLHPLTECGSSARMCVVVDISSRLWVLPWRWRCALLCPFSAF